MDIKKIYQAIKDPKKIQIDSRKIKKGDIFWGLKGDNFDGNKFIKEAIEKGAEIAITDNENFKNLDNTIYTPNNLQTLQQLAAYHRQILNIPIIALTGTNGKTTTKELINKTLNQKFNTKATQGNLNNHIGVPLSLLTFDSSTEIGVIEMGANHPREIAQLCQIAQPNYGLITNIGKAHLEGFGSFEGVVKTKTELYDYLKNKMIFVNNDNPLLIEKSQGIKKFTYGTSQNADLQINLTQTKPYLKLEIQKPYEFSINTQLTGTYNFENTAAAIAIGIYFKLTPQQIANAISNYKPDNNRSQIIRHNNARIILDAYNANPASTKAALENIFSSDEKHLIIILGDMFELGQYAEQEHQNIIKKIIVYSQQNTNKQIQLYAAGTNYRKAIYNINLPPNIEVTVNETTNELKKIIETKKINSNSIILIKGSRGMAMEKLIPTVKRIIN